MINEREGLTTSPTANLAGVYEQNKLERTTSRERESP